MRAKAAFLLCLCLAPATARGICLQAEGARSRNLIRGSVVACRSALPDIEASLEARRERHEEWAQPLRDHLPNADRLWALRPYDELVKDRLTRVSGVILTFRIDSTMTLPAKNNSEPTWQLVSPAKEQELFFDFGSSSCDSLIEPLAVLVEDSVCCDVEPPSQDSCIVGLPAVSAF